MSRLAQAIALFRMVFDEYAGKEGDNKTLTKAEMAELLRKEFGMAGSANQAEMDKFFSALDNDGDGVVDFQEYITFVAALSVILTGK